MTRKHKIILLLKFVSLQTLLFLCVGARAGDGTWTIFSEKDNLIKDNFISSLITIESQVWAATPRGIVFLNGQEIQTFDDPSQGVLDAHANKLLKGSNGEVWAVFNNKGISHWKSGKWIPFSLNEMNLHGAVIEDVALTADGNIAVLSSKGEVSVFDKISWQLIKWPIDVKRDPSAKLSFVLSSFDGKIWVASGTILISYNGKNWKTFVNNSNNGSRTIRELVDGRDGSVWITYSGGGLNHIIDTSITEPEFLSDQVYLLGAGNDGTFYISSDGGKLRAFLTNKGWEILTVAIDSNGGRYPVSKLTLNKMYQTGSNNLWVTTAEGFLGSIQGSKLELTDLGTEISSVFSDLDGNIWAATFSGVRRLSGGTWMTPDAGVAKTARILSSSVSSVNDIWFGTELDGLLRFRKSIAVLNLKKTEIENEQLELTLSMKAGRTSADNWILYYSPSLDGVNKLPMRISKPRSDGVAMLDLSNIEFSPSLYLFIKAFDSDGTMVTLKNGERIGPLKKVNGKFDKFVFPITFFGVLTWGMWTALLLIYPYSKRAQAVFFWSPAARKWLALGLVDFLVLFFPKIRKNILSPFRQELLGDAGLPRPDGHFHGIKVKVLTHDSSKVDFLENILSSFPSAALIIGQSGIGKSHTIKWMIGEYRDPVVFLNAIECNQGVIPAIMLRLPMPSSDSALIERLIYLRTLVVVIDGINEVNGETLAQIGNFSRRFSRGRIVLTTQPFRWDPPIGYKKMEVLPLEIEEAKQFLLIRLGASDSASKVVDEFFQETIGSGNQLLLNSARAVLSVPYDLDLVAHLLANNQKPSLYRLQEQRLQQILEEYRTDYRKEFPLLLVAKAAYDSRLAGSKQVSEILEPNVFRTMVRFKYLIVQKGEGDVFIFRHDRIQDSLIAFYFESLSQDSLLVHFSDPRFVGVFVFLAGRLPESDAASLLSKLALSAAQDMEHRVVDAFVKRLSELGRITTAGEVTVNS